MSEFKSVDAWALMTPCGVDDVYYPDEDSALVRALDLNDGGVSSNYSVIPVTISPRAEWVKVTQAEWEAEIDEYVWWWDGWEKKIHPRKLYMLRVGELYMRAPLPQAPEGVI